MSSGLIVTPSSSLHSIFTARQFSGFCAEHRIEDCYCLPEAEGAAAVKKMAENFDGAKRHWESILIHGN
jgi:hypothetical protein